MIRTLICLDRLLPYEEYLRFQEDLRARREELILVCEHPSIITGGVKFQESSLTATSGDLEKMGISFVRTSRGGDATAHEPGQVVFYVHLDLKKRDIGISRFFRGLLDSIQSALFRACGIRTSLLREDAPGLYLEGLEPEDGTSASAFNRGAKIASIGVQFKAFFTSHGIAVNFSNNLAAFSQIHPCGDPSLAVTSAAQLGRAAHRGLFVDLAVQELRKHFDTEAAGNSSDFLGPGSSVGRAAD